ncbi:hypothetical protein GUITHDRAFT_140064 [Guillardia theta CCMP2712]|uniref:RING-type domain-containing protein n=1 Tax=Guillardia theta (strain CCMP2712) TaxID=905079 RepID=L1J6I1_GUITC|nr:hypothetical protein GUITHDRAFT_140064 [Guillardia theta CCMP2712]EKX43922.1 hypothetical protein GUITHDRAFT_140064 [Guillardia theta CCMP2712]|eukprot:XP_005830902.1 hypothetical protein GUITHDRAFT_140064 [Guillardia theta CCMP2712]
MPDAMTGGQYSRRILRINRFTILMDVVTTSIAVGLVIFYIFSLASAPLETQSEMDFKLLLAYVCFTVILRIFYMIQLIAKLKVYWEHGPCEVTELPFQNLIDFVGKFVPLVEPGHIICLCWMTSRVFPFKSCGVTYWAVCRSMQIASTVFVAIWIFTGLFVLFVIFSIAFYGGNQARRSEVLTMTPIPDPLRHSIINNLPISHNAPPDNDPCAICFEVDTQHEWRVLPCGHRFHPNCIDDWLRKPSKWRTMEVARLAGRTLWQDTGTTRCLRKQESPYRSKHRHRTVQIAMAQKERKNTDSG